MLLGYAKTTQMIRQKQYILKRFELSFTLQNTIFQQYYQSYCNYLLKLGYMDERQAVFEQSTLSNFKKWSSTALKAHSQV